MLKEVEIGVRTTQNNDDAVAFAQAAALVLEACILRKADTFQEILRVVVADLKRSPEMVHTAVSNASMTPLAALDLVMLILSCEPPSFADAAVSLGKLPAMKTHQPKRVSLVA